MTLKIIGPGFGRTGTSSLKIALEHLGFGPTHHMFEVRDNADLQLAYWESAAEGRLPDWDRVFAGYGSQMDWPGARFWRELAQHYPDARIVLSVRDPDEWFDSVSATILPLLAGRGKHPVPLVNRIAEMGYRLIDEQVFGGRMSERSHATKVFRDHIATVQATIPAKRLLTFDVREGWEPLCTFLDVPIPAISFPRLNSSKHFNDTEWKQEA